MSLLLRLPFLGQSGLNFDEIWSVAASRLPWRSALWVIVHTDSNASLYYALLHVWMHLGNSEATMRLLAVLLGVAAVPAIYMLGRRLVGKPAALIASLLVAINGFHIEWSQQVRGYSLLVLLSILSSYFFVRSIEQPLARNWCGYILASVLAVYAHLFAVLMVAAHGASLGLLPRREVPWKRLLASSAAIGVLTAPLGFLVFARGSAPVVWVDKLLLYSVHALFFQLAGNAEWIKSRGRGELILAAYFVVGLVAMITAFKVWRRFGRSRETWRLGLLVSWFALPIGIAFALSLFKPVLFPKYLLICLPPLALLAAYGIQSMRPKWVPAAALALFVSLAAIALPPYYRYYSGYQGWKSVSEQLMAQARPGDAVIFCAAPGRMLFDYYRARDGWNQAGFDVVFPDFADPATDSASVTYRPPLRSGLLDYVDTHYRRVWVAMRPDRLCASYHDESQSKMRQVQTSLSAAYPTMRERRIGDEAIVQLYSKPAH